MSDRTLVPEKIQCRIGDRTLGVHLDEGYCRAVLSVSKAKTDYAGRASVVRTKKPRLSSRHSYLVYRQAAAGCFLPLVPSSMSTMAKLVRVERTRSRAGARSDQRALLSTGNPAEARTRGTRSHHRKFVAVLLPETTAVTATMSHSLRRRRNRPRCKGQRQHNQKDR